MGRYRIGGTLYDFWNTVGLGRIVDSGTALNYMMLGLGWNWGLCLVLDWELKLLCLDDYGTVKKT